MYEYRESTDFILTIDFDDVIIPKNFDSLNEEFDVLVERYPMAASFEFLWAPTQVKKCKTNH